MISPESCDETDQEMITVDEALHRVLEHVHPLQDIERLRLKNAHRRVVANDLMSPMQVPPHSNSAMDGYAFRFADLDSTSFFQIAGTALAGHPYTESVKHGECIRVMTGSIIPGDCNTVVQQEHVIEDNGHICIKRLPGQGANIRYPGEDIEIGDRILSSGQRIDAAELGLMASVGLTHADVRRLPRVAFFSTGDELRTPGESLREGEIYDSNHATLSGLLDDAGVIKNDLGLLADNEDKIRETLIRAAKNSDLIITSGGASVGIADHITRILRERGEANFWKIAMKPGKPLNFGHINHIPFFGLPGNPVSMMVTFALFVVPALQRLRGEKFSQPLTLRAVTRSGLRKTVGRADYQRGQLLQNEDGSLAVETTGYQSSHILSGMSQADCLIRLGRDTGNVEPGTLVDVIPFSSLFR